MTMSLLAMSLVWQNFPRGGSEKLTLLALADWCDDEGKNLYPSIQRVAKKISASESQARRIIHGFIDEGLLMVVANHNGGSKGSTRQYRLNIAKLAKTPSTDATPSVRATPSTDARDGWHPCALPLAPMTPNTLLTVSYPSDIDTKEKLSVKSDAKKQRTKNKEATLQDFLDRCKADGVKAVPETDPIFDYANTVGLTEDMLAICWFSFKSQYLDPAKRQKDWRAHYRNAVKRNWFKLWYIGNDGSTGLTTAGQQAQREMHAKAPEVQS